MTLLSKAEAFYAIHTQIVDDIVANLKSAGVSETDLDDIAHDVADEVEASSVNNAGMTFQVASALEGNGIDDGRRIVFETSGINRPNLP